MQARPLVLVAFALPFLGALGACGDDPNGPGAGLRLTAVSAVARNGTVMGTLPDPLVVRVVDAHGNPVAGRTVRWTASSGSLNGETTVSAADGTARVEWTLGDQPGSYEADAALVAAPGDTLSREDHVKFVAHSAADAAPPVLTGLRIMPSTVDVSDEDAVVTLTISATDAGSGVAGLDSWAGPGLIGHTQVGKGCGRFINASLREHEWQCAIVIPRGAASGTWTVDHVTVRDRVNNESVLLTSDLLADHFPVTFTVVSRTEDRDPPVLTALELSTRTVDVSDGPATITVTAAMHDSNTGIEDAAVRFRFTQNAPQSQGASCTFANVGDGQWRCALTIPRNAAAGRWNIESVDAIDRAGNIMGYRNVNLREAGFPSYIEVVTDTPDTEAPVLTAFSVSPDSVTLGRDLSPEVTFRATVTDVGTGVKEVLIQLFSPQGAPGFPCIALPVAGEPDVYSCKTGFDPQSADGSWTLEVNMVDAANNRRWLPAAKLAEAGFDSEIAVRH